MNGTELMRLVRRAAAEALNAAGDDLAGRSIPEAPVETGELRASARYPSNDPDSRATADHLEANVSFNTVYAAAQHEGHALQHRQQGIVKWVVHKHPGGGKSHYLSDPFKEMIPRYEALVGAVIKKKLEEHHV